MIDILAQPKYRKCRGCGKTRNLELAPVCPICLYKRTEIDARKRLIQKGLRFLKKRHQDILKFRFGMDDGKEKTQEEAGRKFGISRVRVCHIENAALRKIAQNY